ncbi:hypothetical protein FKP32DRAFT_1162671 [Trametes sanguinea]|nr:hypothetical protein FKP32DRAFT_1162671 [Trametes sanguinea]
MGKVSVRTLVAMLVVLGSCAGVAAAIAIDELRSLSTISSSFALKHNIPRTVVAACDEVTFVTSTPIVVPTPSGWFISVAQYAVRYERDFDIVLGQDWLLGSGASVSDTYVCDPSASPVNPAYRWERSPSLGEYHACCRVCDIEPVYQQNGLVILKQSLRGMYPQTIGIAHRPPLAGEVGRSGQIIVGKRPHLCCRRCLSFVEIRMLIFLIRRVKWRTCAHSASRMVSN